MEPPEHNNFEWELNPICYIQTGFFYKVGALDCKWNSKATFT